MINEQQDKWRRERVQLETDRHMVVGDVTLPEEGYRSRFSDSLNRGDIEFLALVNVEITPLAGGETVSRDFVAVSKGYVRLAFPLNEAG